MRLGSALLLTLLSAVFLDACSYRNEDINRVVDPYWSKEYFNKDDAWYFRTTVTDAPPESSWISIADGDWLMLEKIRWEITKDALIGWRDYPTVPGAEADAAAGADDVDFRGPPVAVFAITDHFDIRKEFDPTTGEESNVISENRDRLWYDRAFIRVAWNRNLVGTYKWHVMMNQLFPAAEVRNNEPGNPERWRFEDDYFEVTTRVMASPDLFSYFQFYGVPYAGDSSGEIIDMRHSFMKVKKSDYIPLPMPPTVMLEDENGNEVRDADGYAVRVPLNDRFGFFGSLGRRTFDANRGMVASGQIFNAARFNTWKRTHNDNGTLIPVEERDTKPIVYYTNFDHPQAYMNGSRRVEKEWNRAFRDMIWKAQPNRYSGDLDETGIPEDVPTMFVLHENDCNVSNVKKVIKDLPKDMQNSVTTAAQRVGYAGHADFDGTVGSVQKRLEHANDDSVTDSLTEKVAEEAQAHADLERICSALEYYTGGDMTVGVAAPKGIKPFKYQRLGDNRYSMMDVIPGNFQSGWSGLGPPYADPITGETISATANVAAWTIDRSAARAAQWVEVMNGQVDPSDFLFGYDIDAYMRNKLLQVNGLTTWNPKNEAFDRMDGYFDAVKQSASGDVRDAIGDLPPGRNDSLMARVAGTEMEQLLLSDDDITAFGGVNPADLEAMDLDDAILESASPVRAGGNHLKRYLDRHQRIVAMGQRAMDAPEMVDPLAIGRAIQLRDLTYAERLKKLREDIFVAVMLHEVGHNMGLFHNMAGSADPLNYGQAFWDMQALPTDIDDAIAELQGASDTIGQERLDRLTRCAELIAEVQSDDADNGELPDPGELDLGALNMTTQECLRQTEVMYSSIMDYHANWNADNSGLGPYDLAAIKFGYAQLLEVFADGAMREPAADEDRSLKRRLQLDDWREIPNNIVNGTENVSNRTYVKMDWNTSSTRHAPLATEVPYKFGYGAQMTPDEKPFDFGPDFQSNAKNELTRYYQYYFFTHFSRNRLLDFGEAVNAALDSDIGVMFDFTQKMQWYFFLKATDKDFAGSYLERDLLGTTMTGLNLLSQIVSHPSNGIYVEARKLDLFGLLDEDTSERNTSPSGVLMAWSDLGECTARQVADVVDDDGVFAQPKTGLHASLIPLSEGRPFFLGFTDDYEDLYTKYVGTNWTKGVALQLMGSIGAFMPRADADADPRIFDISWYRLFPREITQIYYNLITEHFFDLGPTVVPAGQTEFGTYVPRNVINADGTTPDYSGNLKVLPNISYNHQYFAMLYGAALLSSQTDDTLDMSRRMTLAQEGSADDMSAFDNADPADVATFVHPVSGLTLRGLRVGEFPIAYDLIGRINRLRERFVELDECVSDMDDNDNNTNAHLDNPYCSCVNYYNDAQSGDCEIETVEPVGERACTPYVLRNRRDGARESMDDLVDYANNLRTFNQMFFE